MILKFEVIGNQENPKGNPIPYVRSTQRGQFKKNVVRYNRWKLWVLKCFYDLYPNHSPSVGGAPLFSGKIFESSRKLKFRMGMMIHWANDAHADPDNVFKGIADALFSNDKYLAISGVDFCDASDGIGKVEITIEILSEDA